ncbi:Holliday junction resolvase RuvX [Candidatus Bandiella euplotis]|uniref:Putative pre-16S rRNA nuclease n=1 Tax=Candidatus Bandiella euplotis TaxID=1664265 RepID=A0ABZ0ULN4_9RICK|nr:Holliday junction resolvase RuvX [Candidatus Bandiella woodruffii]WPX96607.1 Putative Holliday junction resolvase RuvX domain protein [Candidatus Bandiella woodruffii]
MICESKADFLKTLKELKIFKVLGIDFGARKSGLAIYNSEIRLAIPTEVFEDIEKNLEVLLTLIKEMDINGIIIGLPLKFDGSIAANAKHIVKFAETLATKAHIPTILSDERCTTALANTLLKESNIKRKKRNQIDDIVAACILLENFFQNT